MRIILAAVLALVSLAAAPAMAQSALTEAPAAQFDVNEASMAAAHRVLVATGAAETMTAVIEQSLPMMLEQMTAARGIAGDDAAEMNAILLEEMRAEVPALLDMIARGYASRFSVEDMDALTAFFETPAGVRYVKALPQLTADMMLVGSAWGSEIVGPRASARIEAYFEERRARETP